MKKNRVHGIQPARSIAVRWLGAYGKATNMDELVAFEMNPGRQVACEIMELNTRSGIRHARVGLLIDQQKTKLVRAYAGDSWTVADGHRLIAERNCLYVTKWEQAGGLRKLAKRNRQGGRYIEGTIESPNYKAIVVKDNRPGTLKFAELLSEKMGLPVLTEMQVYIQEACK